jgi:hypothetical protein
MWPDDLEHVRVNGCDAKPLSRICLASVFAQLVRPSLFAQLVRNG